MRINTTKQNNPQNGRFTTGSSCELEQIARQYVKDHGSRSLGHIDTPSFVRGFSKVALMPPSDLSRKSKTVEPDKKITALLSVLKGMDLSPATREPRSSENGVPQAAVPAFGV